MMNSYGFKVVPESSDDTAGVPVAVAGQVMVDVQKLLTDIGCSMVRMELRMQNEIPDVLKSKFDLRIGSSDKGLSTGPSEGNEDSLEYAMKTLYSMLDFFGTGAVGSWMEDVFQDDASRKIIVNDILALHDHLAGYRLLYTDESNEREFYGLDRDKLVQSSKLGADVEVSAALGVITRDPVKHNRWNISNDNILVPIDFDKNIVRSDIPSFANGGAVIVIGNIVRNKEGHIIRIDKINGCFSFPEIKFHKVISSNGDRILLNPIVAKPGYDSESDEWSLRYDELGINVVKPSWDECVVAFHDYVAFLFNTYLDVPDTFEGEEKEVRELLKSLLPA